MSKQALARLDNLAALVNEKTTSKKNAGKRYIGLEHIPSASSRLNGFAESTDSISTNNVFRRGDILFGKLRPQLRKSVRAPFGGYCSTDILVLRPRDDVDPVFVAFVLQSDVVFSEAIRTEEGTKMPRCSWSTLKDSRVYCPEPARQVKIGLILSVIDQAIERTEALIEKYQRIKAGLMHDLFTRGIGPDGKLRPPREQAPELYQQTPIGWIPKEWAACRTLDLCYPVTKGTTPPTLEQEQHESSIPFLRVENLSFDGSLRFEGTETFVERKFHERELARSRVLPGDLVMNIVGPPLGKVSLVDDSYPEWNANQAIAIFRLRDIAHRSYLLNFLLSEKAHRWFLARAKQTSGQVNLTLEMCNGLEIPFPQSPYEVSLISGRLECRAESERRLWKELRKLKAFKNGLMHDLLTGKVQVNPDSPMGADAQPHRVDYLRGSHQPRGRDEEAVGETLSVDPT
ncbi:hypothetical protein [Thiohalocapsa sp. ML1]|uniref:hypothetical protein n=1 Tax=Thiohalocapsa sp. ML1 TaxID=1431688 RepID=UPI0012E38E1C|nr:hypothetical protein [Thiohalocapsa sp. ML1]